MNECPDCGGEHATWREARRCYEDHVAAMSPQERLRRRKEAEAWASMVGDRFLEPMRTALESLDDDADDDRG